MTAIDIPSSGRVRASYPTTGIIRTKACVDLLRSRFQRGMVFTAATIVAVCLATNLYNIQPVYVLAPVVTMLSTLAVYLMNDIADIPVDRINAPQRPLASGLVSKSEAFMLVAVLSVVSFALAFLINPLTLFITGTYFFVGLLYSIPKVSLKDRFVIKTLTIAVGGFLTSLIGSSVVGSFDERVAVAATLFFSLIFVSSPLNDLADYAGDKKNGRRTIPIVIGPKNTTMIAVVLPFAIAGAFWLAHAEWNFSVLAPIGVTTIALVGLLVISPIYKHLDDFKYIRKRHKKIVFLHYGMQFALFVGML
jgi:geranylgeranylglycerol-phosphate geranylgeranyltransferase